MWLPKWQRNEKRLHTLPLLWRNAEKTQLSVWWGWWGGSVGRASDSSSYSMHDLSLRLVRSTVKTSWVFLSQKCCVLTRCHCQCTQSLCVHTHAQEWSCLKKQISYESSPTWTKVPSWSNEKNILSNDFNQDAKLKNQSLKKTQEKKPQSSAQLAPR